MIRSLLQHHREHLREGGLTDETIATAGIYSFEDSFEGKLEAGDAIGWGGPFSGVPAIAFPIFDPDKKIVATCLRPDAAVTRKDGSAPKYEWPGKSPSRLYYSPLVATETWRDTNKAILITEGVKKALALSQSGFAAIAAPGVWMLHDVAHREQVLRDAASDEPNIDRERQREDHGWRLHPDIRDLPLKDRTVFLVFDGKDTSDNMAVILAEARAASMLMQAGATVRLVRIPHTTEKVGIDDYLAKIHEADRARAIRLLIDASLNADPIRRAGAAKATKDPTERAKAVTKLLADLSFAAAIELSDPVTLEKARQLLGITKETFKEAVQRAHEELHPPANPLPETDPSVLRDAEALLRDPQIVDRIVDALHESGVVGEDRAIKTILLAGISAKTESPINVVCKAESSTGKSYIVRSALNYFPSAAWKEIGAMSPQAMRFRTDSLKHKILFISEAEGGDRAKYDVRILQSEKKLIFSIPQKGSEHGQIETVDRVIEGPICFITTTTRATIHQESETRSFDLVLDGSIEQNERIVDARLLLAAKPPSREEQEARERKLKVIQAALGALSGRGVVIPNAMDLKRSVNLRRRRVRRDISKVIAFVESSAILHQRRRSVDDMGRIIATEDDIRLALTIAEPLKDEVGPRQMQFLEQLWKAFGEGVFTGAEARQFTGESRQRISELFRSLAEEGLFERVLDENLKKDRRRSTSNWRLLWRPTDPAAPSSSPGAVRGAASTAECTETPGVNSNRPDVRATGDIVPTADRIMPGVTGADFRTNGGIPHHSAAVDRKSAGQDESGRFRTLVGRVRELIGGGVHTDTELARLTGESVDEVNDAVDVLMESGEAIKQGVGAPDYVHIVPAKTTRISTES